MAHEIEFRTDSLGNKVPQMWHSKAVVPWHGLGQDLDPNESIDQLIERMEIKDYETPEVLLQWSDGTITRDLAHAPVGRLHDKRVYEYMSKGYKIHQPKKVLAFYKEFVDRAEMTLTTVGFLANGANMWALASIDKSFQAADGDGVLAYCLLSTSFDGSQSTLASDTNVCVVCKNTDRLARDGAKGNKRAVSIPHSTELTDNVIAKAKEAMGLCVSRFSEYTEFIDRSKSLKVPTIAPTVFAAYLAKNKELRAQVAVDVKANHITPGASLLSIILAADTRVTDNVLEAVLNAAEFTNDSALSRVGKNLLDSITGHPGADLTSRQGTAWGLHSGVTHYVDHIAGRSRDTALESAWFGQGNTLKAESQQLVYEMLNAGVN